MDCKQAAALLHEFLDQELRQSDPAGESALAAHLESCAACRQMVDAQAELRAAVRQHAGYRATPPALLETIREGIEHSTTGGPQEEQAAMHALPLHRPRWQWWSRWGSFGSIMSPSSAR